jgi:hypothetical protein
MFGGFRSFAKFVKSVWLAYRDRSVHKALVFIIVAYFDIVSALQHRRVYTVTTVDSSWWPCTVSAVSIKRSLASDARAA